MQYNKHNNILTQYVSDSVAEENCELFQLLYHSETVPKNGLPDLRNKRK